MAPETGETSEPQRHEQAAPQPQAPQPEAGGGSPGLREQHRQNRRRGGRGRRSGQHFRPRPEGHHQPRATPSQERNRDAMPSSSEAKRSGETSASPPIPRPDSPSGQSPIQEAVERLEGIRQSLESVLTDLEEVSATLEQAGVEADSTEHEIRKLRDALDHLQRR